MVVVAFQLNEMNGKMLAGKPLYVAVAQRKDERKAWLQVTYWFSLIHDHFQTCTRFISLQINYLLYIDCAISYTSISYYKIL